MTLQDDLRGRGDRTEASVGKAAVSGARWLPTAQMVNQIARIVLAFVLAWFLTTEEFGLVAVATIVMTLIDRLADMGTGQAVIQRKQLDDRLVDAIFVLNMSIGVVLGGVIIVFAEPLTALVGGAEADGAVPLMRVLGVNVIIKSAGVVQYALLRRRLQFRKAAMSLIVSAILYFVIAVVLAIADAGAWSIVIATTVSSLASVSLTWAWSGWLPRWRFDWPAVKEVSGFSLSLTATNIFNFATQNVDRSLISHSLGVASLGVYSLGTRILRAPIITMTKTVNQVLLPTMARLQDDLAAQRMRFLQATAVAAVVVFPAMLGLTVLAEPIVDAALPERWAAAVPLITWMAPIGMMRTLWGLVSPIYVANARTGKQLVWSIFFGSMLIVSYVITAQISLQAVVIGIAVVHVIAMPVFFRVPFAIIELRLRDYAAHLVPVTLVAGAMAAAVLGVRLGLESAGWSSWGIIGVGVPVGIVVYLGLLFVVRPPGFDEVMRIAGAKVSARRTRGAVPS